MSTRKLGIDVASAEDWKRIINFIAKKVMCGVTAWCIDTCLQVILQKLNLDKKRCSFFFQRFEGRLPFQREGRLTTQDLVFNLRRQLKAISMVSCAWSVRHGQLLCCLRNKGLGVLNASQSDIGNPYKVTRARDLAIFN